MQEHLRFQNTNFREVFGELEKVHRIERGCFETFGIPAIVFGCFLFGCLAYLGSEDWVTLPICALPFLLLFCLLVWHLFTSRRDELRIYENGFTYRGGKKLHACLWEEIKTCHRRERDAEEVVLSPDVFPLASVEKNSGETIEFERDIQGTPEIAEKLESYRKAKQSRARRSKSKREE